MNIRKTHRNAGLSRAQPGELSGVGQSRMSRIEHGRQDITAGSLFRIARAPSAPVADLIAENGERRA